MRQWANICVTGVLEREVRENGAKEKEILRNNGHKLLHFDKNHRFIDTNNSSNTKKDKYIENHTETHHNQISRTQRENLESRERKTVYYIEGNNDSNNQ